MAKYVPNNDGSSSDSSSLLLKYSSSSYLNQDYGSTAQNGGTKDDVSIASKASSLITSTPAALTWHNLNVHVKMKQKLTDQCRGKPKREKQILSNVNGAVGPGQLIALMGSSGAGKTTLLNTLTGRNVQGYRMEGEVLVNGQSIGRSITSISAYVQQQDLFIGTMTVQEHLMFQAILRLPKTMTWEKKKAKATALMHEMGLSKCANTLIGAADLFKGISGGEKKRLAFASELFMNPSIFFCDEPTTGLDSFMAEQVVTILQKMANSGKTVICTIHQPASEVYGMFNNVLFLAEGRTAFFGPRDDALKFFADQGLSCPKSFNPADFFIQTMAILPGKEKESREKVMDISRHFEESVFGENLRGAVEKFSNRESGKPLERINFIQKKAERVNFLTELALLLWRAVLYNYRNQRVSTIRIVQKIIMGLFVGLLYFNTTLDQTGIMDLKGVLYFMVMQMSMPATMGVLRILPVDFPVVSREHHNGMYSVGTYYWTRVLSYVPLWSIDGIIFQTVCYFMIGLRPTAYAFFLHLLVGVLLEQCSCAFGTMISASTPNFPAALQLVGPILTIVQMVTGLMANVGTLPVYISWIQYLSWFRYGFECFSILQLEGVQNITCSAQDLYCISSGDEVLAGLSFNPSFLARDIGLSVALASAFYIIGYVAFTFRITKDR